MRKKWEKWLFL